MGVANPIQVAEGVGIRHTIVLYLLPIVQWTMPYV